MSTTISGDTGVDKATNQAVKDAMGVTGTAPIFGCRAWVNFDGTRNEADTGASVIGQNVKIRASGNVSSVLKNAVGDYTVNFTTAMPDVNYVVNMACKPENAGTLYSQAIPSSNFTQLVSSYRLISANIGNLTLADSAYVYVSVFR